MKNRLYKLLKIAIYTSFIGMLAAYSSTRFLNYKMNQEVKIYHFLANDMDQLTKTYALCTGLLITNATKENKKLCKTIKVQLDSKILEIKDKCPYISFYTRYMHNQ